MKRKWWRRRWVWIPASIVLLIFFAVLLAPMVARPIVRAKLEAMLRPQIDADVRIGGVGYWPPYQFSLSNVHIAARQGAGKPVEIFSLKRLSLSLDKSPFADGPVIVNRLDIDSPN